MLERIEKKNLKFTGHITRKPFVQLVTYYSGQYFIFMYFSDKKTRGTFIIFFTIQNKDINLNGI